MAKSLEKGTQCNSDAGASPSDFEEFGIYVHVPFCEHRCSYCDFYSLTDRSSELYARYRDSVLKEIEVQSRFLKEEWGYQRPAVSIFLGGGTPSLLPVPYLSEILDSLRRHFGFEADAEITIEANPETVNETFLTEISQTPINRVSLGAQSLSSKHLETLDRLARPVSVRRAAELLSQSRFRSFNLDLIFGIPGQTAEEMLADIEEVVRLGARHSSFYNLTLKDSHPLANQLPDGDACAELYVRGVEKFRELGFEQYEISNFSQPGFESRHNSLYWSGGDFLGLGPSAASRFFRQGVFGHRKQMAALNPYLEFAHRAEPRYEWSSPAQTVLEAVFLELRKNCGVAAGAFQARYGYDIRSAQKFSEYLNEGFIEEAGEMLRLTSKGRLLADLVCERLVDLEMSSA